MIRKLFSGSLILLVGAFVLVSCQSKQNGSDRVLTALVEDVDNDVPVYISALGKGNRTEPVDTTSVQNGQFSVNLPKVDFQTLYILRIDGVNDNLLFINENTPLKMEIDKNNLRATKVEGGQANKIFSEYLAILDGTREKYDKMLENFSPEELEDPYVHQEVIAQLEAQNTKYRQKTIEENPNELPSLLMLADILRTQQMPVDQMQDLFDGLSKEVKNTFMGREIGEELANSSLIAIGSMAPEFSAKTPEGEELALKDALGKYTLVDFWAAWCLPCRHENPNIVEVYEKYHDQGFNVLGVSLDKDRDKWLEAIEKDGLVWNQISNLQFWEDPIAQKYNIRAIPANFLLDAEGKIVATNLRGQALQKKIRELFD